MFTTKHRMIAPSFWEVLSNLAEWGTVGFTVAAALSGVVLVAANRQVKKAETVRAEERNRKLAADLKDKDVKIAEADERAAEANERAEVLKHESLTIQKILRPRRLLMYPGTGADSAELPAKYKALDTFAGTTVMIVAHEDSEPKTLASDLFNVLASAGWKPTFHTTSRVQDGIYVYAGAFTPPGPRPDDKEYQRGRVVAEMLDAGFKAMQTDVDMIRVTVMPTDFIDDWWHESWPRPKGTMVITVGRRAIESELMSLRAHTFQTEIIQKAKRQNK